MVRRESQCSMRLQEVEEEEAVEERRAPFSCITRSWPKGRRSE